MVSKLKKIVFGCVACFAFAGSVNAAMTIDVPGNQNLVAGFGVGTETVTIDASDPVGFGTASSSVAYTAIVTDATGASVDRLTVDDGIFDGQFHAFTLKTDNETSGLELFPTNFGPGTSTLFQDAGDGCLLMWDGVNWQIVSNVGGTVQ